MLAKKHVKEVNGTPSTLHLRWMSRPYNCIVLAKYKVGCSWKALPKDDEELE